MTQFVKEKAKKIELFYPKKITSPPLGDPKWEKITNFVFSILGIRMAQFTKRKQKKIFEFFDP